MAGLSVLAAFAYRMSNGGFHHKTTSPFSRYTGKSGDTSTSTASTTQGKDQKKNEPPTELEKRITDLKAQIQQLQKQQNNIDKGNLSASNKAQQKQELQRKIQTLTNDLNRLQADNTQEKRLKAEENAKNDTSKGGKVNTYA